MRRLGWLLLVLWLAVSARAAVDGPGAQAAAGSRATFDLGVQAYRAGDFQRARSLWLAALDAQDASSVDRGALLFDLGNATARTGAMLEAVGWYTAALRVDPRNTDARKNLEFARQAAKLEPADRGDLGSTLQRIFDSLTVAEASWLALAILALFLAALIWEALRGGSLARRVSVFLGALTLTSVVPWIFALERERTDGWVVIAQNGASLHSEPRAEAATIETLAVGAQVRRFDALPGWIKVSGAKNDSGWVREDALFALAR